MPIISPLQSLDPERFETPLILKKLTSATRQLAELKGVVASIPNQGILINTLGLREAKDSSEIENIVTTYDQLFKDDVKVQKTYTDLAVKEVLRYRQGLHKGYRLVKENKLITNNHILEIQAVLEQNNAGFRKLPGTVISNKTTKQTVYTPPQDPDEIIDLMNDLERFTNDVTIFVADPLIKMGLIHHQFESIHPFYDGNGRTGRIISVLYLVKENLLNLPVLYLSSYIVRTKSDYYRLLQDVRDKDYWENWVMYVLDAVEKTAEQTITTIYAIKKLLQIYKNGIRSEFNKFYSQDLINNLFKHPYTKAEYIERDLKVTRLTAIKYLDKLSDAGYLKKQKVGRSNYYINTALIDILAVD